MSDDQENMPRGVFRTFHLATDSRVPEIDAIGIGLTLLAELPPDGKRRVAEYWRAYAEQYGRSDKAPSE